MQTFHRAATSRTHEQMPPVTARVENNTPEMVNEYQTFQSL
jgi:hypothetical protein